MKEKNFKQNLLEGSYPSRQRNKTRAKFCSHRSRSFFLRRLNSILYSSHTNRWRPFLANSRQAGNFIVYTISWSTTSWMYCAAAAEEKTRTFGEATTNACKRNRPTECLKKKTRRGVFPLFDLPLHLQRVLLLVPSSSGSSLYCCPFLFLSF